MGTHAAAAGVPLRVFSLHTEWKMSSRLAIYTPLVYYIYALIINKKYIYSISKTTREAAIERTCAHVKGEMLL